MKDEEVKEMIVNVLRDRDEEGAGLMLAALFEFMILSDGGYEKQREEDKRRNELRDIAYQSRKELEKQLDEILSK